METQTSTRLMGEFPPHRYDEWQAAAVELLKGRPFEKTLFTPTYEGFPIEPLYTRERCNELGHLGGMPGMGDAVRGSRVEGYLKAGWQISQELSAPTPKELNAIVLEALEGGQNEVNLWLDDPSRRGLCANSGDARSVGVCGLSLATAVDFETLLKGVELEMVTLNIQSGAAAPAVLALLAGWNKLSGKPATRLSGCVGYDPIGWLVEKGSLAGGLDAAMEQMDSMLKYAAVAAPELQVIDVQGHVYHNGGGSSAQEMAAVLATANAYLKAMVSAGHDAAEVARRMRLSVSIGGNYFIEIAKLRALRLLWSKLLGAYGVDESQRKLHIHARTGLWNKTVFDPYVNMLRTTAEAFAAVVGGCDSLHVGAFDEVIRESDTFSRRISRNTHAILAEECGLAMVLDPAGGSWAVESLTDQIGRKAWELLQDIETKGGMAAVLESGDWQSQVEQVRQQKAKSLQQRRDVMVGTNTYPNATEKLLDGNRFDYAVALSQRLTDLQQARANRETDRVDAALLAYANEPINLEHLVEAAAGGATLEELCNAIRAKGAGEASVQPVRIRRAAEDFEGLRMAALALRESGKPARLLQLNMGPSRRYRARADWTSAFFQVSGIEVANESDFVDADAAVEAVKAAGAKAAIITSDDETYATVAADLAARIKQAAPGIKLLLAGAPGDNESAWRAAGIDDFVNVRVNNYQFNRSLLEVLGATF